MSPKDKGGAGGAMVGRGDGHMGGGNGGATTKVVKPPATKEMVHVH